MEFFVNCLNANNFHKRRIAVFCLKFVHLLLNSSKLAKSFTIEQLKETLKGQNTFSREELYHFYSQFEPDLKETTFRWRVFQLKGKKIITPLSRNLFSFNYKPLFKPEIKEMERKVYNKINKQFPTLKQCIWSTKVVSEFMVHQPGRFVTILEVENDALEPVFHFLKDINIRNIFLQPEEKEIERYVFEAESPIILQSLVSKAPTQKLKGLTTITIEKMIVDIYCDWMLFNAFQGNELINIIHNAYHRYAIDFTKLLSYARRRRRETDLMEYLSQKTDIPQNIFND